MNEEKDPLLASELAKLLRNVRGGIWTVEPGDVVLEHWRVFKLPDGTAHFVGFNTVEVEGRVSSSIRDFDFVTMTGHTKNGRGYTLAGPSGYDDDAFYVLESWLLLNNISLDDMEFLTLEEFKAMFPNYSPT